MLRFFVYCLIFCLSAAGATAFAARQPIEDAPLSKQEQTKCVFNQDGSKLCTTTVHYTILKPAGRELLSRLDFSYPETDEFEVRQASVIQPGGKPLDLDKTHIDTRTAPNPAEGFRRLSQTSLAFPNLRTGTQVRYTIQQRYAATPLAQGFHHILEFPPMPVRVDSFKAEFTASQPIHWRAELADDFLLTLSADQKTLVVEQKAPRYLNFTNEAEHAFLSRIPRIELGNSLSLGDYFNGFSQRYNEILNAVLPPDSANAVQEVRTLPAAQRVARLMEYIHERYRYLGDWRDSERGHVPFSLAEIEQRGYGDCKDLAVLLTAMLRAANLQADPALVARGQVAPDLLIPGTYAPNHAIVRAEVDGQTWWLDPTNPFFIPGRSMEDIQERWAIVLAAPGLAREETIPLEPPSLSVDVQRTEHFGDDGEAQVDANVKLANLMQAQISLSDREQGLAGTDRDLCARFGQEISDCILERPPSDFVILPEYRIDASLTDLDALRNVSGKYLYQRDDLAAPWEDFAAYQRNGQQADLYFGDPLAATHDVSLAGKHFNNTPKDCSVQSPWFDISLQAQATDDELHYRYQYRQKKRYLTHEQISSAAFQEMARQARDCVATLRLAAE